MKTTSNNILFIFALSTQLNSIYVDSLQCILPRTQRANSGRQRSTASIEASTKRQGSDDSKPSQISDVRYSNQTIVDYQSTLKTLQQQPRQPERFRRIARVEKFARLPVWPVLNGVLIWLAGNLFGSEKAAQMENAITGRVCPNFYQYSDTSPFIMLVHHCHTFSVFDPVRYIQRTFFPEGFPAHPHRGFITITYIMHGGFIHRDSEGVQQAYGTVSNPHDTNPDRYNGKHTQWLTTGRGMLHEEMFDITTSFDLNHLNSRQELYQIWLNVPASYKMDEPCSLLLGGNNETPVVYSTDNTSKTLVLAGMYDGQSSIAPLVTELVLFHVTLQPGARWKFTLPSTLFETAFIYLRQGTLRSLAGRTSECDNTDDETIIPVHHTAYFERRGGNTIQVTAGTDDVADFMFLAGVPIPEPCYASGSMVMNFPSEIDDAYRDYQKGLYGIPWDHKLSNEDWQIHVQNTKRKQR
jgi:redox-sensitive bicupin YhaK (pirin superfamily)